MSHNAAVDIKTNKGTLPFTTCDYVAISLLHDGSSETELEERCPWEDIDGPAVTKECPPHRDNQREAVTHYVLETQSHLTPFHVI